MSFFQRISYLKCALSEQLALISMPFVCSNWRLPHFTNTLAIKIHQLNWRDLIYLTRLCLFFFLFLQTILYPFPEKKYVYLRWWSIFFSFWVVNVLTDLLGQNNSYHRGRTGRCLLIFRSLKSLWMVFLLTCCVGFFSFLKRQYKKEMFVMIANETNLLKDKKKLSRRWSSVLWKYICLFANGVNEKLFELSEE